jgi:hypothetical protein
MNKLNLAAFILLSFITLTSVSCKKFKDATIYTTPTVAMSGALSVPPNASTATGSFTGSYNDVTKTFSYTINYTGLTGNLQAVHVHGPASPSYAGAVVQSFSFTSGTTASGSYSNSLFVDGVVVKEEDLLAGQYYIDLHTAVYPATGAAGANLRGQIVFN